MSRLSKFIECKDVAIKALATENQKQFCTSVFENRMHEFCNSDYFNYTQICNTFYNESVPPNGDSECSACIFHQPTYDKLMAELDEAPSGLGVTIINLGIP